MTEIILHSTGLPDGTMRYDLAGKNLPANFLGLAADIRFDRSFLEGDFLGMENGPIFQSLSPDRMPLIMAKALPEQGKLVLGISMKARDLPGISDGILTSFRMTGASPAVTGFEKQILSIFNNGREDLSTVIWSVVQGGSGTGKSSFPGRTADAGSLIESRKSPAPSADLVLATPAVQAADLNETALLEALNVPFSARGADFLGGWWWVWPFLLIITGLSLAAIYVKYRKSAFLAVWPEAEKGQIKLDY